MKNKFFNKGLYLEGIRQLRMVGIIAFVIFAVEAILIPVGKFIEITKLNTNTLAYGEPYKYYTVPYEAHIFLLFSFTIFAPIFVMMVFKFLNKRSSADFYHSLPQSRTAVFTSIFASVLTWLAIIIFGSSIVSGIMYFILSNNLSLSYILLFKFALNCFAASFLVAAAISLAMTITGTTFSNIIVSGLIIFLPRLAISTINATLLSLLPMVPQDQSSFLLTDNFNIVTSIIFSGFQSFIGTNINASRVILSSEALIYTTVLAIIYTGIACFLFNRRKSEDAGNSAPNRVLQAIYRIIVTMTFCLFICITIMRDSLYSYNNTFTYIVLYIIAVLIYFIYELVTTKRWKNLLRAIPGLAIVAALNGVILGGMFGIYYMELNFTPKPDEIKSVSIINSTYDLRTPLTFNFEEYLRFVSSDIEIVDDGVIKYVSNELSSFVTAYEHNPMDYKIHFTNSILLKLKIRTDGETKYRYIYSKAKDLKQLNNVLTDSSAYKQLYTTLPKLARDNVYLKYKNLNITGRDAIEIYELMQQELNQAEAADWKKVIENSKSKIMPKIFLPTKVKGKIITVEFPLIEDIMPKAFGLFYQKLSEGAYTQLNDFVTTFSSKNEKKASIIIKCNLYDKEEKAYSKYIFSKSSDNKKLKSDLEFFLERIKDKPINFNSSYAVIEINTYNHLYCDPLETPTEKYVFVVSLDDIDESELPEDAYKIS